MTEPVSLLFCLIPDTGESGIAPVSLTEHSGSPKNAGMMIRNKRLMAGGKRISGCDSVYPEYILEKALVHPLHNESLYDIGLQFRVIYTIIF